MLPFVSFITNYTFLSILKHNHNLLLFIIIVSRLSISYQDPSMAAIIWNSLPPIWPHACHFLPLKCHLLSKESLKEDKEVIRESHNWTISTETKVLRAKKPYNFHNPTWFYKKNLHVKNVSSFPITIFHNFMWISRVDFNFIYC